MGVSQYGYDCNYCGNCYIPGHDRSGTPPRGLSRDGVYCMSDKLKGGCRKVGSVTRWDGRTPEWCPVGVVR